MHEQLRRLDVRQTRRLPTSALTWLVALCVAAAMLSGCARKYFEWKEQVQLSAVTGAESELRSGGGRGDGQHVLTSARTS